MTDNNALDKILNEWQSWRNLDHRLLNDGNPSKLAVSVDLFVMEQRIDDLVREIKLNQLANQEIDVAFAELEKLVREYQHKTYVNILRGEC